MIEPWQVWRANLDPYLGHEQGGTRPVVVVSSELHLRTQGGRSVLICPLTSTHRSVLNHVPVTNPKGQQSFVMTEQIRYITTLRFARSAAWWVLTEDEIVRCQRALRHMVDF